MSKKLLAILSLGLVLLVILFAVFQYLPAEPGEQNSHGGSVRVSEQLPDTKKISANEIDESQTKDTVNPLKKEAKDILELSAKDDLTQPANTQIDDVLVAVALAGILVAMLSIVISFHLYRWRIRISDELSLFVPEQQIKRLDQQLRDLDLLKKYLPQLANLVSSTTEQSLAKSSDVEEGLLRFQDALKEKDKEISRLKKGYDASIYSRFLGNFYRIYKATLKSKANRSVEEKDWDGLIALFENAFENAGAEFFTPKTGMNFQEYNHLFKPYPKKVLTLDESLDFTVESIIAPGLRSIENKDEIFIPAEAQIYIFERN